MNRRLQDCDCVLEIHDARVSITLPEILTNINHNRVPKVVDHTQRKTVVCMNNHLHGTLQKCSIRNNYYKKMNEEKIGTPTNKASRHNFINNNVQYDRVYFNCMVKNVHKISTSDCP